jgi:hypothetical protein
MIIPCGDVKKKTITFRGKNALETLDLAEAMELLDVLHLDYLLFKTVGVQPI